MPSPCPGCCEPQDGIPLGCCTGRVPELLYASLSEADFAWHLYGLAGQTVTLTYDLLDEWRWVGPDGFELVFKVCSFNNPNIVAEYARYRAESYVRNASSTLGCPEDAGDLIVLDRYTGPGQPPVAESILIRTTPP
jgi:hypothetical protein